METKLLLRKLWDIQAHRNDGKEPACRFQLQTDGGRIEYLVCSSAVMLDYAPVSTNLEPGKLYTADTLPLKKLEDFARVDPNVFLSDEAIPITQDIPLDTYFLPLNNKEGKTGLGVFRKIEDTAVLENVLPYKKDSSFPFAGLALFHIPEAVQAEINKNSSMAALGASICKVRSNASLAAVFACDTAMLVVTLARVRYNHEINEHIFLDSNKAIEYRLDGYRDDQGVFSRLVKVKNKMPMKGLANPVSRLKNVMPADPPAETAPATQPEQPAEEPQIEDVKPEQAEEIAQQAPDVTKQETPKQETAAEEPKKRTRAKRQPVSANIGTIKGVDELIAYLAAPIPDGMTSEAMQEEVKKLRDLGVVVARRQSNLYTAATAAEKKLRDTLRGVLG